MHQQGEGTTEVKSDVYAVVSHQKKRNKNKVTEPPSEDIHYAVISFQRKTEDRKPYRNPEDSVTYSAVGLKGTADTY
ncbi:hypothetical protein COCON_G00065940 [Conger conger]|uniref:Uncharacterized protein n=1 Tax=Conger conger TaxID=82655 RepID=A0A9Q1I424_CONCO|nr:hypothetical protein COCON_G00065940 [Conger conger]